MRLEELQGGVGASEGAPRRIRFAASRSEERRKRTLVLASKPEVRSDGSRSALRLEVNGRVRPQAEVRCVCSPEGPAAGVGAPDQEGGLTAPLTQDFARVRDDGHVAGAADRREC